MRKAIHVIALLFMRALTQSFYEELGLSHDHNISTNEIEFTFQKLLKELQPLVEKGRYRTNPRRWRGSLKALSNQKSPRRTHQQEQARLLHQLWGCWTLQIRNVRRRLPQRRGRNPTRQRVRCTGRYRGYIRGVIQRDGALKFNQEVRRVVSRNVICPKCSGTGAKDGKMKACSQCGGRGVVMVNVGGGFGGFSMQMQQHCPSCGGRGKIYKDTCPHCRGQKVVPDEKDLIIKIKPGTQDKDKVIFTRESEQRPGMTPGDVVFNIRERAHPVFIRAGNDLYMKLEVGLKEAITGFSRRVKSISGKEITISGGRNKLLVRLAGEGMPEKKRPSKRGDLIVQIKVRLPSYLNHEQQQLIEEIF